MRNLVQHQARDMRKERVQTGVATTMSKLEGCEAPPRQGHGENCIDFMGSCCESWGGGGFLESSRRLWVWAFSGKEKSGEWKSGCAEYTSTSQAYRKVWGRLAGTSPKASLPRILFKPRDSKLPFLRISPKLLAGRTPWDAPVPFYIGGGVCCTLRKGVFLPSKRLLWHPFLNLRTLLRIPAPVLTKTLTRRLLRTFLRNTSFKNFLRTLQKI